MMDVVLLRREEGFAGTSEGIQKVHKAGWQETGAIKVRKWVHEYNSTESKDYD